MASVSTKAATKKSILKTITTLKGHGEYIPSISYFTDGQRIISASVDKTTHQWDVKAGKEFEEARDVCEGEVWAAVVSQDGRWLSLVGDIGIWVRGN
jgi:WD40 repeat protein